VQEWLIKSYTNVPSIFQCVQITSLTLLEEKINYKFIDKKLFIQALTHTSYTHESIGTSMPSQERLEFLGDSIVNMLTTNKLFNLYPHFKEGELSKLRGALVNEKIFAELATLINLADNIFVGHGEFTQKGQQRSSLLADTFEALIGAIYLESGINAAETTYKKIIELYEEKIGKDFYSAEVLLDFDAKTQLQEICMSLYQEHPQYKSKEIGGEFQVSIWLKEKCLIESIGNSKKKLEKELAKTVLTEKRYQI
jgi:ribonuclease-3